MKLGKLSRVLALCIIGFVIVASYPSVNNQKPMALSPLKSVKVSRPSVIKKTKHTVVIKNMAFDPFQIHVHKGDTVIWINKDMVPHNVTDFPDANWTSGTLALGKFWEKNINDTFDYFCSIHPTMKGKIIVDP